MVEFMSQCTTGQVMHGLQSVDGCLHLQVIVVGVPDGRYCTDSRVGPSDKLGIAGVSAITRAVKFPFQQRQ